MASFEEGLRDFFTKGVLVKRCRITDRKKAVILEMLQDTSEKTCDMEEDEFDRFMTAKRWILHQLDKTEPKQVLDVRIAGFIKYWLGDYDYYPFNEEDFEGACIWIMNKLSKKYSLAEMSIGKENI